MKKIFLLLLTCWAACAVAAPVKNLPVMRIQPQGDTLRCFVTGDEFYHRMHDESDYTIILNPETGWYVYAAERDGMLVPTQLVPGQSDPAKAGLKPGLMPCAAELRKLHDDWIIPAKYQRAEPKTSGANHGQLNNIVIFIRFSDETSCTSDPFSTINNKFNDSTAGAVSMYNYFKVDSYRKLHVPTHFYPAPSGATVMSYQDSHPRGYYEPYSSTNTVGYQSSERTNREFTLLQNAVNWINTNSPIPSSVNIDFDNDGYVDNICFIVSGTNNGWNDMLWPHKWSLYDRTVTINGKRVWTFNLQLAGAGEHYFGVSTLCHEMTHTLGVPDLYHYNNYSSVSPAGSWDLMHSNATPPQQTNSLHKLIYLNWFDSIPLLTTAGTYTMQSLATGPNHAYKIASTNPHQWYILEYRNNADTFDSSIPGRGMLIWRYNDQSPADNASFNGTDTLHEMWLFRPGSSNDITNGTIAQAGFGESGRTAFGPNTNPHPYLCNGTADTSFSITNIAISSDGHSVSFTFTPNQITCGTVSRYPHVQDFENGTLGCWTFVSADSSNDSRVGIVTNEHHGGANSFRFSSYSHAVNYNQYLISPQLASYDSIEMTFYYKRYNNQSEAFSVKYSTTTDSPSAFTHTVCNITASTNGWQLCSVMLPPEAKYVCINYHSSYLYYLYIDDITLIGNNCTPITTFPHAEGFESGELGCWNFVSADNANDARCGVLNTAPHNGIYSFRFSSYSSASDYNQFLISPKIQAVDPVQISFYYKRSNNSTENFRVRYSTTTNDTSAFTQTLGTVAVTSSAWQQFTATLPANAKYVAVNYYSNYKYYLDVDDFLLTSNTTHDTTYIYIHDTLTRWAHDTLAVLVHDTLQRMVHDTLYHHVTDTVYYTLVDTLPRTIYDTVIMEHGYSQLMVVSNNMGQGLAVGSGTYLVGSEVQVAALAKPGFNFDHWQDGSTDNPRMVTITANNQILNAYFSVIDGPASAPRISNTLVHDTIAVHDTTWITLRDTVYITLRDTTWTMVLDTVWLTLRDTLSLPFAQHDTVWVDTHVPFEYDTLTYYTLTVSTGGFVCNPGWTSGSGRYPAGTVVEIDAMLNDELRYEGSGVQFLNWHGDTDNLSDAVVAAQYGTAKVTMLSDTYVEALFGSAGAIDQPQQSRSTIYTSDGTLVVESEMVSRVAVYNVMGQQVYADSVRRAEVASLPAGVYLVRVGDAPARKVVIVR